MERRQRERHNKYDERARETTRDQGWTQTPAGKNPQSSKVSQLNHVQQISCTDHNQEQGRGMRRTSQSFDCSTPTDPSDSELRLVLVGRRGAGKSATGNTILGSKHFRSRLSASFVTGACERVRATVRGRNLMVVDTPGFSNTVLSQDAIQQEVQRCRELCSPGPHAVLLIVPLGRLTEEERQAVDTIQQLFSSEVPSCTILVFTHADMLRGESIQDFISRQSQSIQELVERFSHRFVAINNRHPEDENQVDQLLEMVDNLCRQRMLHLANLARPLRMVLVGRTGTGKSATGNTILGGEHFRSELNMSSVTEECQRKDGTVQGRDLILIDTPGLFDTSLSQDVVQREIVRCLTFCSPGPHVVLLTVRLGASSEEAWCSTHLIENLFQYNVRQYIILIFTHADLLDGTEIQDFISEDPRLQELVERFDGRYLAFNNMETEDHSQVSQLLEMIDSLLARNENQHFTNRISQAIERAVAELLSEAIAEGEDEIGRFQYFYRWCQSHPYIAASLIVGAGALGGAPLVMSAMAPVAVVEVGLLAQFSNLALASLGTNGINAIIMKLAADGTLAGLGLAGEALLAGVASGGGGVGGATLAGAGLAGAIGAVLPACCIQ